MADNYNPRIARPGLIVPASWPADARQMIIQLESVIDTLFLKIHKLEEQITEMKKNV